MIVFPLLSEAAFKEFGNEPALYSHFPLVSAVSSGLASANLGEHKYAVGNTPD
jgi:hypothetical protein